MSYDLSIAQLRGTAAQLKATNDTVAAGRLCKETDTGKWKSGTGLAYNSEAYILLDGEEGKNADVAYDVMRLGDGRDDTGGTTLDQDIVDALEAFRTPVADAGNPFQTNADLLTLAGNISTVIQNLSDDTDDALALKADIASIPKRYKFTGDGGAATGTIGVNTFPMAVTVTNPSTGFYRFTATSGTPFTVGKTYVSVALIDPTNPLTWKLDSIGDTQIELRLFNTTDGVEADPSSYLITIETEP